jgi:hypothetical protein
LEAEQTQMSLDPKTKTVGHELRFPTGLIMPESIVSSLEYKLAPKLRSERIEKAIDELNWYYLMLDLTPQALKQRLTERYSSAEFDKLLQTPLCQEALVKAGWHADLVKKAN